MTESQTFAWILLSVPDSPGTLQDIITMADAINHAIPTQHELQTSLGWLQARGLVRKDGRRFCTTDAGAQLLNRLRRPRQTMMKMWDLVAEKLEPLRGEPAAPENITLEECTSAYNNYKKAFWKAYSELEKKDREV
ncbi:MAG: winged helix-turn-helix domain-containing protein [Gallionellaceae bacterium]|jgi:hypothetical protein|nr:winged helix-turn-helix domain-containing protein [Gallionellaceae bacterium]